MAAMGDVIEFPRRERPILTELYIPVPGDIGRPIPQGSNKSQRGRVVADNPEMYRWRAAVSDGVRRALGDDWQTIDRPTQVGGLLVVLVPFDDVTVRMAGDDDKHKRCMNDALTIAKLWRDDSQANGWAVFKMTAGDPGTRWPRPGFVISAWTIN